ncbi:peptidoglycan DD-metalloendopeptidase family protein [Weeksellaceae bacterium KMM 9713]|uniref:Peptidoglycan DD-metalloendopeptidase family protein n=1 Tax=Profundicola chukchiensis TaxID=2961959 RepID=A0A9X4MUT9_9FLAO|nr:peptidoglycan DD-metalloendopeptidase family protein [Profundicola chukchiensis]MDG4945306.1 peptidoglycan DD-metalloendopeptidase family protein [Profundicola chukchiensis]MDG4950379.1 peptidoglycan DD-metalloendopeptidase family protein [Profundicola chukchiensis]
MKRIFALFLLVSLGTLLAQQPYDKEELRKKSKALTNQIAKLNKTLSENRSVSSKSIVYIKNLDKKIQAQTELVSIATKERKVLEDEIYLSQLKINKLKRELGELKKEYKDVLINAYKNKSMQNKVLFILSSKSFTEAFRRIKYLEKYSGFQGEKADDIKEKTAAIERTISDRENAIQEKENVLAKQRVLREKLEQEKKEQSTILAEYRKNEGEIRKEIAAKQVESKRLDAEIQRIIEEEIRIAREKAEAERKAREEAARKERERLAKLEAERLAKEKREREAIEAANKKAKEEALAAGKPAPKPEPIPEPEPEREVKPEPAFEERSPSEALGSSFAASQGRLPWPVVQGDIVGRFGRVPHAVLPGIYENHAGVLIATSRGGNARAVYEGTVQAIMPIKGGNKAVMVSHGTYFTVYNNLATVYVSKGDKISNRQELGKIYTDSDGNTILDFQVWKGTSKQDPANWVSGM